MRSTALSEQIILSISCKFIGIAVVYMQVTNQITKNPRGNRRIMNIDYDIILKQARRLYGALPIREIKTGHSGSLVFEMKVADQLYILRAAQADEIKLAHAAFEIQWMNYLSGKMAGIVKSLPSVNGNLFEVIEANKKKILLTLQEKAMGRHVNTEDLGDFNEALFSSLGLIMGQMHRLTIEYPENTYNPQFRWNGPHFWRKNIPIDDEEVRQGENRFLEELECLPMGRDNFGIVHFDIHTDNFLVDGPRLTIIDFETCQFNWYAADIASALFFLVQKGAGPLSLSEKERIRFAENCLLFYLKGYRKTNAINPWWIGKIDLFMRYQMVDEYVAVQLSKPQSDCSKDIQLWQQYRDWYRDRIVQNKPYVAIDYEKVLRNVL